MNKDNVQHRIKEFIGGTLLEGNDEDLEPTTPILEWGLLDSVSFGQLNAFLENEFSVIIPPSAINAENYATITAIADMVILLATNS